MNTTTLRATLAARPRGVPPLARTDLPPLDDPARFVCRPYIPILVEDDAIGCTPQKLRILARNINTKALHGHYGMAILGHTADDVPETALPPCVGYLRNATVGTFAGKQALLVELCAKREWAPRLGEYPYRSAEVWGLKSGDPDHLQIDHVSLQKTSPRQYLGMVLHYEPLSPAPAPGGRAPVPRVEGVEAHGVIKLCRGCGTLPAGVSRGRVTWRCGPGLEQGTVVASGRPDFSGPSTTEGTAGPGFRPSSVGRPAQGSVARARLERLRRGLASLGRPDPELERLARRKPARGQGSLFGADADAPAPGPGAQHAPAGGAVVAGKHFAGGEFIPAQALAQATPVEVEELVAKESEEAAEEAEAKVEAAKAVAAPSPPGSGHQAHPFGDQPDQWLAAERKKLPKYRNDMTPEQVARDQALYEEQKRRYDAREAAADAKKKADRAQAEAAGVRPDGRLYPKVGDKVFQTVPGPFGMPAVIDGQVFRSRDGSLRVRVTGGSSMVGAAPVGKTFDLHPAWTVEGDPELARRKQAREEKEAAARRDLEAGIRREKEATAASRQRALDSGHEPFDPADAAVGDVITSHWGGEPRRMVVTEVNEHGEVFARPEEEPDESGGYVGNNAAAEFTRPRSAAARPETPPLDRLRRLRSGLLRLSRLRADAPAAVRGRGHPCGIGPGGFQHGNTCHTLKGTGSRAKAGDPKGKVAAPAAGKSRLPSRPAKPGAATPSSAATAPVHPARVRVAAAVLADKHATLRQKLKALAGRWDAPEDRATLADHFARTIDEHLGDQEAIDLAHRVIPRTQRRFDFADKASAVEAIRKGLAGPRKGKAAPTTPRGPAPEAVATAAPAPRGGTSSEPTAPGRDLSRPVRIPDLFEARRMMAQVDKQFKAVKRSFKRKPTEAKVEVLQKLAGMQERLLPYALGKGAAQAPSGGVNVVDPATGKVKGTAAAPAPEKGSPERRSELARRLRAARARLRAARPEPAPPPRDPATHTDHPPGTVAPVRTDLVHFDPARFQYKLAQTNLETGEVGSLAGVEAWNPELAGVVQVWKDPADGKLYVVNGHNRLGKAKAKGVPAVNAFYIDAKDAGEARAKGALTNIAEGRGTATDAAKFFRGDGSPDQRITPEDLKAKGVQLRDRVAAQGLALAGLANPLFQRVVNGTLTEEQGATIGGSGLPEPKQVELAKLADEEGYTNAQLREAVDEEAAAEQFRGKQGGLSFGGTAEDEARERAETRSRHKLKAYLRKELARTKNLFGTVADPAKVARLKESGNVLDEARNQQVSADAAAALWLFGQTANRRGPLASLLARQSSRLAEAKNDRERNALYRETLDQVVAQAPEWLEGGLGDAPVETPRAKPAGPSFFDEEAA